VRDDPYRILQVDRSAHPEVIRAAYRALLRVVGKHPDVGGSAEEARAVIEAYQTLIDTDRRRAYDLWLKAHAAPPDVAVLPAGAADWITAALPDHHPAPTAPFAAHFDLVLGPRRRLANLVYVKAASLARPATWPRLFTLWRAVRLGRSGGWPYRDVILAVSAPTDRLPDFLAESARPRTRASLNRCALVACTFPPPALHAPQGARLPAVLRRLGAPS
jgi:hypothetical protein